jgi:plastocyanin
VIDDQEPIVGGTERTYQYDALLPGTYEFICAVHPIPGMTGTLTVR